MDVERAVKFIDEELSSIADENAGATEQKVRAELGAWMVAFRISDVHRGLITAYCESAEEMVRTGRDEIEVGRVATTIALNYFILGMRAARKFVEEKNSG